MSHFIECMDVMDVQDKLLLKLLRIALFDGQPNLAVGTNYDWELLFDKSVEHGILAWVWDGICKLPELSQPPRVAKINWGLSAQETWNIYAKQEKTLIKIVEICKTNNLKLLLLKGIGIASFYPKPESRPCGDIDIYLFGDFAKGNLLLAQGDVEFDGREATFYVDGIAVENHAFMTYKKSRKEKRIEQYLQNSLKDAVLNKDGYYNLCPQSNLIYLLMHSITHFASSSYPLPLRSIVDYGMCLVKYIVLINFNELHVTLKRYRILKPFSLFVGLAELVLNIELKEYHFVDPPKEDISKAFELVMSKKITERVPWNIPFIKQLRLRRQQYMQYKWIYNYLPYTKVEIFKQNIYTQLLILSKKILCIPEDKRFIEGIKDVCLNKHS